jgi:hypothetical protein
MALVVADRVQETTTTIGTGTMTLAGAISGFQSFATIGDGNTTYYCVTSGTAWEVGIGTYTSAGTTLARTTILASSAAGAAISLAGTSNVFCVYPASKAVYEDASGNIAGYPFTAGTINSTTIGASSASTGVFTTVVANTSAGIGAIAPTATNFYNAKNITGAVTANANNTVATVQSDVTNQARGYVTSIGTVASAFTLSSLRHFHATQATIGASSAVTNQYGFLSENTLIGATNNYGFLAGDTAAVNSPNTAFGFYSAVNSPTGTGITYGFYSAGTAPNAFYGTVNIGTNGSTGSNFVNAKNITGGGAGNSYANNTGAIVQSDVTGTAYGYFSNLATAASVTLGSLVHFGAQQSTFSGTSVTNQYGFNANGNLIGATNNYSFRAGAFDPTLVTATKLAFGFYSESNTATGGGTTYNFYAAGTAPNVFTGTVNIGSNGAAGNNFYNTKSITGALSSNANSTVATVQSDVTNQARGYNTSLSTAAAAFTLTNLRHFYANQGTIGAGSTVTAQVGFLSENNLVGATNNYGFLAGDTAAVNSPNTAFGFYSAVNSPTGTGTTYGFYAAGTANNVFRGNTYFGSTVTPTAKIHVAAGSATASTAPLKFTSGTNLTAIEAGVVEYDGTIMTATPNANFKRGTIPITNYTSGVGTSLTATAEATLQVLLPAANDTITLSIGTYFLDLACTFTRGTVSTTSAQAQINILGTGGAVGSFSGMSLSSPTAGGATANFAFNAVNINVSNVVTAASTTISGVYTITLRGMLKVTTAGTIIPQYNLSANLASAGTATAPNVLYFRLQQIDTQSAAAFGPAGTGWG